MAPQCCPVIVLSSLIHCILLLDYFITTLYIPPPPFLSSADELILYFTKLQEAIRNLPEICTGIVCTLLSQPFSSLVMESSPTEVIPFSRWFSVSLQPAVFQSLFDLKSLIFLPCQLPPFFFAALFSQILQKTCLLSLISPLSSLSILVTGFALLFLSIYFTSTPVDPCLPFFWSAVFSQLAETTLSCPASLPTLPVIFHHHHVPKLVLLYPPAPVQNLSLFCTLCHTVRSSCLRALLGLNNNYLFIGLYSYGFKSAPLNCRSI